VEEILSRVYSNADGVVHNVNSPNREFYAGKCAGIKELMKEFESIKEESSITKGSLDAVD
jgi:hypothetical protein